MQILTPGVINGLFALSGTIVGFLGTIFASYLGRKAEERRHIREIGLKIGTINFENAMEQAQNTANLTGQKSPMVAPLYLFVLEGITLAEIATDPSLSIAEITARIEQHRKRTYNVFTAVCPK